jgi:hypothetical protein
MEAGARRVLEAKRECGQWLVMEAASYDARFNKTLPR